MGARTALALGAAALILAGCANDQKVADLERRVKATEDEQARHRKVLGDMGTQTNILVGNVRDLQKSVRTMTTLVAAATGQPVPVQAATTQEAATVAPLQLAAAPANTEPSEIVSVSFKPGETNSSWTRYGWKLTLRNNSPVQRSFDIQVDFVDAEGFPLDHATAYNVSVRSGENKEVTGEKMIDASIVPRVRNVRAKAKAD
jgi:hypothetical protein